MPLGEQVRTLRPDVVLVDLDGERIDTALHGLRSARAGVIVLDDDPRRVLVDEPAVRGLLRGVLPRDASSGRDPRRHPRPWPRASWRSTRRRSTRSAGAGRRARRPTRLSP